MMTGKERIYAALGKGCPPDDIANTQNDTYAPLTLPSSSGNFWKVFGEGKPWWIMYSWDEGDWEKKLDVEAKMQEICDLDWVWGNVALCPSRVWRRTHRVVASQRGVYMADVGPSAGIPGDPEFRDAQQRLLEEPKPDGSFVVKRVSRDGLKKYGIDMTELIKGKEDIEQYVVVEKDEELIEEGKLDWVEANVKRFGESKFITAGNNRSAAGNTASLLGQTTYLKMMIQNPKLLKQITDRMADKIIEEYKAYKKVGADGTECWEWITGQFISPAQFNEFVKPYTLRIVEAARQIGFKYIYGTTGVGKEWMEGLESMLEIPFDAIQLEEAVKGMDTDIAWLAPLLKRKGLQKKVALLGNIATINIIKDGTIADMEKEIKRQVDIGRDYGKFIMVPGAPITPDTTFKRAVEYCRLSRKYCQNR